MAEDLAGLWEAARVGDLEAQIALARHYLEEGQAARGLKWLRSAVQGGSAAAAVLLAREYRAGRGVPRDLAAARRIFATAAAQGDAPAALELSEMLFAGLGGAPDRDAAREWLRRSATAGHGPALRTLACIHAMNGDQKGCEAVMVLARPGGAPAAPVGPESLFRFRWPEPGRQFAREPLSQRPRITALRGFMTDAECDYVVSRGAAGLRPAQIADPATGAARVDLVRTGSDAGFGPDRLDIVLRLLEERMAAACGVPVEHGEPLVLLHYAPGQEYRDHFDFLGGSEAESEREARFGGQRIMTVLVWLNQVTDGGGTVFPRAGVRFRGNQGDALIFRNVTDSGEPDPDTLHHGAPVVSGEKWLLSKWIRERPHPV